MRLATDGRERFGTGTPVLPRKRRQRLAGNSDRPWDGNSQGLRLEALLGSTGQLKELTECTRRKTRPAALPEVGTSETDREMVPAGEQIDRVQV